MPDLTDLPSSYWREWLPDYLRKQRWFGGKSRTITDCQVVGSFPVAESLFWLLIDVSYSEGDTDLYQLPVHFDGRNCTDALANETFRATLYHWLQINLRLENPDAELIFSNFSLLGPTAHSHLPGIEQSNSAIIYDDHYFLKFFRKLEPGLNPDLEIIRYLATVRKPPRVPRLLALAEMSNSSGLHTVATLQELIPNQGNAWEAALTSARSGSDYSSHSALLGRRTAELHRALAEPTDNPAFGIETILPSAWQNWIDELREECQGTNALLRKNLGNLPATVVASARHFLEQDTHFADLLTQASEAGRNLCTTRIHGDYHLGQVLVTGDDFVIIDFEGEPARPLTERLAKRPPLIDVAGMLRSFHYAACAGGNPSWREANASAFWSAYLETAADSRFLPEDRQTCQMLCDVFSLHKALYEIRYELNNRPDWLWIPLHSLP